MRNWFFKKIRKWISEAVGYDAIILGSVIRRLEREISCLKGFHDYSDWSAMCCGNVADSNKMQERGERLYSYRHCWICHKEMPDSRLYVDGEKQKNARDFNEKLK